VEELEGFHDAFKKMPEPLFNAMNAWANGEEWTSHVDNAGALDYGASFDKYELSDIVGHYFPGEFEKDDFTENSDDATVKRAVKLSKQQYGAEQKAFEEQRASYLDSGKERDKLIKSSSASSVEKLKETFPDFGKDALKKVRDTMSSGDLSALFFGKDGAYTDDAATKIALMLFGKDEIVKANGRSKKSQDALKKSVKKGSNKPSVTNTQSQQEQVSPEVTGIFKDVFQKTYY